MLRNKSLRQLSRVGLAAQAVALDSSLGNQGDIEDYINEPLENLVRLASLSGYGFKPERIKAIQAKGRRLALQYTSAGVHLLP